ncbi:MAG: thermonuclease family protein [Nitrospiraceae bacterium]
MITQRRLILTMMLASTLFPVSLLMAGTAPNGQIPQPQICPTCWTPAPSDPKLTHKPRKRPHSAKRPYRWRKHGASSSLRSGRIPGLRTLPRSNVLSNLRGPVEVDGRFLRPIDGDTFAYNGTKVRLRGIDAPETGTPGGFEAAQRLAALLREGAITIVPVSQDVYGRTVADVFLNGQNVADVLIAEGYAKRG